MMNTHEAMIALENETRACFDKANRILGRDFPYPKVQFDLRGTSAGWAYTITNRIRYNLPLAIDNWDAFISQSIPHECAHIIADKYFGVNCHHNGKWQWVMRHVFGLNPNRCHTYDVKNHRARRRFRYAYRCSGCNKIVLAALKHHKVVHSPNYGVVTKIACRACRSVISPSCFVKTIDVDNEQEMAYIRGI